MSALGDGRIVGRIWLAPSSIIQIPSEHLPLVYLALRFLGANAWGPA